MSHSRFIFLLNIIFLTSVSSEIVCKTSHPTTKGFKCLHKCCPKNHYAVNGVVNSCRPIKSNKTRDFSEVQLYDVNLEKSTRKFKDVFALDDTGLFSKDEEFKNGSYDYSYSFKHIHYLTEDGILVNDEPHKLNRRRKLDIRNFCIDYKKYPGKKMLIVSFWTLLTPNRIVSEPPDSIYSFVGLVISSVFLFLILVVYYLLPDQSLSIMIRKAYVASTLGAFIFLAVIRTNGFNRTTCQVLSYFAYFFTLSCFFWMTIMSYDLWCLYSYQERPSSQRDAKKRFTQYCLFAWGVPSALTAFLITVNYVDLSGARWFVTPKVAHDRCFITADEKLLYLYLPMLILIITNWAFFLMTCCSLWSQYRATAYLDNKNGNRLAHRSLKNKFLVFLKLSIIMGINWVLEVGSTFFPNTSIWNITDVYNMLLGFSIFLIFVCNRKTYGKFVKRFTRKDSEKNTFVDVEN